MPLVEFFIGDVEVDEADAATVGQAWSGGSTLAQSMIHDHQLLEVLLGGEVLPAPPSQSPPLLPLPPLPGVSWISISFGSQVFFSFFCRWGLHRVDCLGKGQALFPLLAEHPDGGKVKIHCSTRQN